ncbi:hypothetical protein N9W89_11100 [Hellea sp.]|nr:hypothetical protein [Hellea sp.]
MKEPLQPQAPDGEAQLSYAWPEEMQSKLGKALFQATHNAHLSPQFSDEKLAELLEAYPREKLGIYRFPTYENASGKAEHGCAPHLTGAEILKAVQTGKIWLNLRAVNREVPEYKALADTIFEDLRTASGVSTLKEDMGVLISSPNIHVHYHLDIPLVCLVQLRGEKEIIVYPAGDPYVSSDEISDLVLNLKDEQMHYDAAFDSAATVVEMSPGVAVTWPQTAPHRVQNGNSMNVSLSCEFMTPEAILKANALHTNAILRKKGWNVAAFPKKMSVVTLFKAGLARVLKKLIKTSVQSPVPISFELQADGQIRPLLEAA